MKNIYRLSCKAVRIRGHSEKNAIRELERLRLLEVVAGFLRANGYTVTQKKLSLEVSE